MKKYSLLIVLFILGALLIILFPSKDFVKSGKLYISEVLPKNSYTIKDDDNEYSDYIEIYNESGSDISLNNFHLSDNEYDTDKWTFPDINIKSGEYLIVYASGKDKCDLEKRICHTNFKLSSYGETVVLSTDANNIISKIKYTESVNDVSYGYDGKIYKFLKNPTPGKENDKTEFKTSSGGNYKVRINEYSIKNDKESYISNGGYYDWVELYNYSDKDITLNGFYISDNESKKEKYRIDNVDIKANDYLIVYLTGKDIVDGYICADFKLSTDDKKILISSAGKVLDSISIVDMPKDVSYGRLSDGSWEYFLTPTPGKENSTSHFSTLGGSYGNS